MMPSNESTPLNKGAVSALDNKCLKASSPEPLVQMENNFTELSLKNSEYDQEIPQSQTADNPVAPRGRAVQPSRDTRKTN